MGTTGVSWALLVYVQNCQPTLLVLIDRKVKLVDLFKTVELLNNSYAFYMMGRGRVEFACFSFGVGLLFFINLACFFETQCMYVSQKNTPTLKQYSSKL